ncbi:hypothetical protein WICPIJ_009667 [Wickerhamomyces pijperi]|uniref:Uncharacterized protein n=1 Tax=Wickerhamomyces pijperi TaxID=599730 RepID=A0A9P8TC65_WICPI|nr:hypothetical protein WICPIJ_009667 [Wickerhamomyces pijperi]
MNWKIPIGKVVIMSALLGLIKSNEDWNFVMVGSVPLGNDDASFGLLLTNAMVLIQIIEEMRNWHSVRVIGCLNCFKTSFVKFDEIAEVKYHTRHAMRTLKSISGR